MTTRIFAFVMVGVLFPGVAIAQDAALRKLRILLIADGPMREFQFVRNALLRETQKNGGELSVHIQTKDPAANAALEGVKGLQVLRELPDRASADGKKQGPSLSDYDVIIAFDPNWTKLTEKQCTALKDWVGKHAGGFVFVAGQTNTYQLRRGGNEIKAIKEIIPVVLIDARLHGLGNNVGPKALKFAMNATLKLDAKGKSATAGWNSYFWDDEDYNPKGEKVNPKRGFFQSYPVEQVKAGAEVIATFEGPGKPQPFLVGMKYGNGKTLFLASAETWRLRAYNEEYFPKLWMTLAHHVAAAKRENPKEK